MTTKEKKIHHHTFGCFSEPNLQDVCFLHVKFPSNADFVKPFSNTFFSLRIFLNLIKD